MNKTIFFNDFKAEVKELERTYQDTYKRVINSGWYILGNEVKAFEEEFSQYLNIKFVVGVANGLDAIKISLMALNIGSGDEVITTPLSAVATTLAIMAVGATPIFVDIKPDGQLDETLIEAKITKKTKAILPVHLYGNFCQIDEINKIAQKHNLFLIEDAAQAHGSTHKGKMAGTFGNLGCFSFYPTKNLGAFGDGGAVITNSKKIATLAKSIRDYGQSKKYLHTYYGLNSRLDEFHAAFLRVKLKNLNKANKKRTNNANIYLQSFKDNPKVDLILPINNSLSNYHQFVVKVDNRNGIQEKLKNLGIPTLIHYPTLIPYQPFLKDKYKNIKLPQAEKFIKNILSLPCGPYLKPNQVKFIAKSILSLTK